MDRESLVIRNRTLAEAYHTLPPKHYLRRALLRILGTLPIPQQKPPPVERILLIRPDHLGDLLLSTPAFHVLKASRPRAELHALVGPWSAAVLETNPDLDRVLTLPFPGFDRGSEHNLSSPYRLALHTARQLRRVGYSHAVIMRPDHWWGALVTFLAGIPIRIGYDMQDVSPFLTERVPFERTHAVMQNVNLLRRWTPTPEPRDVTLTYHLSDADRDSVADYLESHGMRAGVRYFCIHPGSGTWVKHWTAANWATVADTLAEQLDATPIFTGGGHEYSLVEAITGQMAHTAHNAVGDTDVGQLAALFANAEVVMGPDSGPLHVAAAVGAPTVALFGPADPDEFGQWGPTDRHALLTSDIGCRPCRVLDWTGDDPDKHPCVREITPGQVLQAARRVARE